MTERIAIIVDGFERRAIFRAPRSGAAGKALVVLLHGKGGTAEWVLEETRLAEFAEINDFCLLVPDALSIDPAKEPKFLTNPQVWNSDPKMECEARMPDDVKFIDLLLTHVIDGEKIDARRICMTGFSNGAGMTFRCAVEIGQRIAAIAPVAGNCLIDPIALPRPMPTLWLMGADDPLMPFAGGVVNSPWGKTYYRPAMEREAERFARAAGCRIETKSHYIGERDEGFEFHSPDNRTAVLMKRIHNLGHHWPGGMGRLNPKIFGPANPNYPGNEAIWEFFKAYMR